MQVIHLRKLSSRKTISITAAISVKEIDFALFLVSCILSLTLYLNPALYSRQEVFIVICQ